MESKTGSKRAAVLLSLRLADIPRTGFLFFGSTNAFASVYVRKAAQASLDARKGWIVGDRAAGRKLGVWKHVGRTEIIRRRCHPVFADTFKIEYYEDEMQDVSIRVEVFNAGRSIDLRTKWFLNEKYCEKRCAFIGAGELQLTDLIKASQKGGEAKVALQNVANIGASQKGGRRRECFAMITADPVVNSDAGFYELQIGMKRVPKERPYGFEILRYKPFIQIYRKRSGSPSSWALVCRSETLQRAHEPNASYRFRPIVVPAEILVNSNESEDLRIEICHHRGLRRYRLLGWVDMSPYSLFESFSGDLLASPVIGVTAPGRKYNFEGRIVAESPEMKPGASGWLTPLRFTIQATPSLNLMAIRSISWKQAKKGELDPTKEAKSWQLQTLMEEESSSTE